MTAAAAMAATKWEEDESAEPVPGEASRRDRRSLSLGLVAMAPMLAAYEAALAETGGARRNAAERLLSLVLDPLGPRATQVRWAVLALVLVAAWVRLHRRRVPIAGGTARVILEGAAAAVLFGPVLVVGMHLLGELVPEAGPAAAGRAPEIVRAGLLFGGAAYEELVFRVGLYSVLYTAVLGVARALRGRTGTVARGTAELVGLVGSSFAFSSFHLASFTGWLGGGGEPFDAGLYTWRTLAGVLLALLFRWRGPGVAAWTHGLFNVALFLGIGPEVLL